MMRSRFKRTWSEEKSTWEDKRMICKKGLEERRQKGRQINCRYPVRRTNVRQLSGDMNQGNDRSRPSCVILLNLLLPRHCLFWFDMSKRMRFWLNSGWTRQKWDNDDVKLCNLWSAGRMDGCPSEDERLVTHKLVAFASCGEIGRKMSRRKI